MMMNPRWLHQCVSHEKFIYVMGGTNNEHERPM